MFVIIFFFFFSSRRRHTRCSRDWSSDVCSSDLNAMHVGQTIDSMRLADVIQAFRALATQPNVDPARITVAGKDIAGRSEERRVGKECRSGWSRYHGKRKRRDTESCESIVRPYGP